MMTPINRRSLLKTGLAGAPLISVGAGSFPLFLQSTANAAKWDTKGEKILVVIQLLGGNDGLNTVVPHKIDGYSRGRRALRLGASTLIKLSDEIGLHASLKPLEKSLNDGRLSVIQGVGYPNPDRSHFRSMDIWESARLDPNELQTGWLGRAMDASLESSSKSRISGVHIGSRNLPLALRPPDRCAEPGAARPVTAQGRQQPDPDGGRSGQNAACRDQFQGVRKAGNDA